MKRLLIAILIVSMVQGVFAQKIEIKGTIRNATDNEATEFVNVVLQTTDSVFVNGVSTNNNGSFIFNKVEAGNYRLVLSCVGYNTQYITLNGVKRNTDLGDIFLEDASVALEGVIINGSNQINRPDRKLVFPSERQMKVSTNGVNLLQELMLPRIQVNPMNNEIGISGGGELQIRINGVKADINEIKALRPADIIRIEYHDNPGFVMAMRKSYSITLFAAPIREEASAPISVRESMQCGEATTYSVKSIIKNQNSVFLTTWAPAISTVCIGIMKKHSA